VRLRVTYPAKKIILKYHQEIFETLGDTGYAVNRNKSIDLTFIQLGRGGHFLNKSYCNFRDSKTGA
jgi:hypothetical protein